MTVIHHNETLLSADQAQALATELNADPDDDWSYKVEDPPNGKGYSKVAIYDEDGAFVGYL